MIEQRVRCAGLVRRLDSHEVRSIKAAVEALLFASEKPVPLEKLVELLGVARDEVAAAIEELGRDYDGGERGIQLVRVCGGYQLRSRPEYAELITRLGVSRTPSLSRAALETLAIIAYRQPISKPEIEWIRGVNVDGALGTLLSRGLVREVGRKEGPGRPILYGTTTEFLLAFGLNDLSDLPPLSE